MTHNHNLKPFDIINVKLNIIEPWECGTDSAVEAAIVKSDDEVFLLYVKEPILVKGERVQYFLCRPREIETQTLLSNEIKGVFPVSMVFDKNIQSADAQLSRLSTYRSNFLFGEIIKNGC